jgi:hypothetical protein
MALSMKTPGFEQTTLTGRSEPAELLCRFHPRRYGGCPLSEGTRECGGYYTLYMQDVGVNATLQELYHVLYVYDLISAYVYIALHCIAST